MSDTRFLQEGFDNQLAHLVEECGEVIAAAGKTQRWGWASVNPLLTQEHPLYNENNLTWLLREIYDLQQAISRLQQTIAEGDLP